MITVERGIPLMDLSLVHDPIRDELRAAFERVLASSHFTSGSEVERFEELLAARVGTRDAIGVGSGTSAIQLMLQASGIGRGDEVILPPNTFFATAEAVVHSGAIPVFADVDPATALLDADAVASVITERTAAIIGVHLYGQPIPADAFRTLAAQHGLLFLEDAAQAIGAEWNGTPVGGLGAAAAFSFYPGKNVGALGEAGAVTTNDPELARKVRTLRNHGEACKHEHVSFGYNERLDELQAAFLSVKLAHMDESQERRDEAVARYLPALSRVPNLRLLKTATRARHVHHLMVVVVPDRDRVLDELHASGIGAAVHYPTPIHLQPAYAGCGKRGDYPRAEQLARSVLSLPLFPGMTDHQVERCVNEVARAVRQVA